MTKVRSDNDSYPLLNLGEAGPEDGYLEIAADGEEFPTQRVLKETYRWNEMGRESQDNIMHSLREIVDQYNRDYGLGQEIGELYIQSLLDEQVKYNLTGRETSLDRIAKENAYHDALQQPNDHLQKYLRNSYVKHLNREEDKKLTQEQFRQSFNSSETKTLDSLQKEAINIQRLFRGHLARRYVNEIKAVAEQTEVDNMATRMQAFQTEMDNMAMRMQDLLRGHQVHRVMREQAEGAVTKLQAAWRGYQVRNAVREQKEQAEGAVTKLQAALRGWQARRSYKALRQEVATLVQPAPRPRQEDDVVSIASNDSVDSAHSVTSLDPDGNQPSVKKHKPNDDGDNQSLASVNPEDEGLEGNGAASPFTSTDRALHLNDEDQRAFADAARFNPLLDDALQQMLAENPTGRSGRLTQEQYNQEVKYESDEFKWRPKLQGEELTGFESLVDKKDGRVVSDRSLQIRWIQQIVGHNTTEKAKGAAQGQAYHHIAHDQYGNTVAEYHGAQGLSELHRHARDAASYYAGKSLKAGEFFVASAQVKDSGLYGDQQFNCEVTASSQGVTLAFVEKDTRGLAVENKIRDFITKHGQDLMQQAVALHQIYPVSLEGLADGSDKKRDAIARNEEFENKRPAIEQTVRAMAREHVMEQTRREMQRNFRQQLAGLPKQVDYDEIGKKDAGMFHQGDFKSAVQRLRNEPDPVFTGSGLAFSQGERDDVVKVSFVANTQEGVSSSMRTAYVYIPGTDECYIRVQVVIEPAKWVHYYENGVKKYKEFTKGQVIIDTGAIHHYVKNAQGGGSYEEMDFGSKDFKKTFKNRAYEIVQKAKNMTIQASSQIDGKRAIAITAKGVAIRRDLQTVHTIDEHQESAQFTRSLPTLAEIKTAKISPKNYPRKMEASWDKTEIYFKSPLQYYQRSDSPALDERRKNVMVRMSMATQDGLVTLNDGTQKFVKAGEVYRHPIPYLPQADGSKKMVSTPYLETGDGLGADFMKVLQEAKFDYKIADEKAQMEEKLRKLIGNCAGSPEEITEIKEILKNYCQIIVGEEKKDIIDINAADPVTGDTALHLAIKRGLFELDTATGDLKADCVVAELLAAGADPMARNFQIGKDLKSNASLMSADSGFTAAGLAIKKGHFKLANILLAREKAAVEKEFEKLRAKLKELKDEISPTAIGGARDKLARDLDAILEERDQRDRDVIHDVERLKFQLRGMKAPSPIPLGHLNVGMKDDIQHLQKSDPNLQYHTPFNDLLMAGDDVDPDIAQLEKKLESMRAKYKSASVDNKEGLLSRLSALRKMQLKLQAIDSKYEKTQQLAQEDIVAAYSKIRSSQNKEREYYKDEDVALRGGASPAPAVAPPALPVTPGVTPGKPIKFQQMLRDIGKNISSR